jgi:8-oxo-dGTP pyrophosphatase MutT (NUDIX family)
MVREERENTPVFFERAGVNNRGVQMLAGYPFRHWSVASSRTVLANRVLKVRQDTCVIPASGGALEYFVLELADWVNVVPVTSARELVMVRQYRHATRGVTLEIPAGSVKENEVPADAARRELLEETGYAAGNLIHLGTWECNPALQTNRLHTFLGLDVEKVAEPAAELDERLEVMTVPQAHWLSDRIGSAFSHYFSSYAIELARAHVRADRVSGRI